MSMQLSCEEYVQAVVPKKWGRKDELAQEQGQESSGACRQVSRRSLQCREVNARVFVRHWRCDGIQGCIVLSVEMSCY